MFAIKINQNKKMINKKLLATTAFAGLVATSNAFSQTTNFVGPSLAITGSYVGASSTNSLEAANFSNTPGKRNDLIPGVDFNYGFASGNNFVIGVGATYDFSKTKIGGLSISNYLGEDVDVSFDNELKEHYSLYVQPTYIVNKDSAIFAKLGRHFAKATFSATATEGITDNFSVSKNIEGWGYGLGLKTFLSNNLFVQAEAGIVNYEKFEAVEDSNPPISIKPRTINGTISIGYKF